MAIHKEHPFAQYVRILGKGKTGSRSLSPGEAQNAMAMILHGQVDDVQLGAFLMLLRVKEESAEEIAGFVRACRDFIHANNSADIKADLDWSSYAGKKRQPPLYLLAVALLAENGYRVFMHGSRGHTANRLYTEDVLEQLGIKMAHNWKSCNQLLDEQQFAYMPLADLCEPLEQLIQLRPLLGLRSPVHTLCRLLNPLATKNSLQSVFHPAYMAIHHNAAQQLGEYNTAVFKGDSGEIEYRPQAKITIKALRANKGYDETIAKLFESPENLAVTANTLTDLWQDKFHSDFAIAAVAGTVAIALTTMGLEENFNAANNTALTWWQQRNKHLLLGAAL
jgi:anthranilate phosphoribosyltransferase